MPKKNSASIVMGAFEEEEIEELKQEATLPTPKKKATRKKSSDTDSEASDLFEPVPEPTPAPEPELAPPQDVNPSHEPLFLQLYTKHDQQLLTAMFYWCAQTDTCYDPDIILQVFETYTKQNHEVPYTHLYVQSVPQISFPDSILPNPVESYVKFSPEQMISQVYQSHLDPLKTAPPAHWGKLDSANFRSVVKLLGYYPFGDYSDDDQKILCRELLDLISEQGDEANYLRVKSALRIVISFHQLKELDAKKKKMEEEGATNKELKELEDISAKTLNSIVAFGRDAGLAERYATQKSKGANTFGGILKTMNEEKFENSTVNLYDIKTSAAIAQVAAISTKAITDQLNMSESQYQVLCAKQMEELSKLREELEYANEQVRRLKKVIKTQKIIDDLLQKEGVMLDDIVV